MFGLGYIVNDLDDGVTEIGRHWWSSIALVVAVLSIGARTALDIIDQDTVDRQDRDQPERGGDAVSCVRPGCQGPLDASCSGAAGVGQGGAPAAKRGRTTLTNPRAGADWLWAG